MKPEIFERVADFVATAARREKIQRSASATSPAVLYTGGRANLWCGQILQRHSRLSTFSRLKKKKRAAFQILLANARSSENAVFAQRDVGPGAAITASVKRSASVPCFSVNSSGSTTLPRVFDIFVPSAVAHNRMQVQPAKGNSLFYFRRRSIRCRPIMIIRASQKNKMSYPLISRLVG